MFCGSILVSTFIQVKYKHEAFLHNMHTYRFCYPRNLGHSLIIYIYIYIIRVYCNNVLLAYFKTYKYLYINIYYGVCSILSDTLLKNSPSHFLSIKFSLSKRKTIFSFCSTFSLKLSFGIPLYRVLQYFICI